ncbi:NAD-dependent epimerase/dehydratase family protein [Sphingorhabdus sp. YGSMI21]|uniref:NAD-dependent epimerase/dehydratase family protein n=1 Tax=Sphingorhabdus sp. YGSMI21 TaxID=2077182 RepID=UPI000C1ECB2D|nr:NAD-dependent epimerase/dehydratase family protein [Sphingorhabdus sp. YGSMI21]ATW04718.1 hypothetical protein CHN51_15120 [Sphingorhabdus sp. YGSMI21]
MRLAITGAGGFVGRAVARHLSETRFDGSVRLIDREISDHPEFETVALDLAAPGALEDALDGVDRALHLAALPGGAAQDDPALSRRINLDLSLDLIGMMNGRRLVYASSIAVFGDSFPATVDDDTVPHPSSVYGTHKRMVELAFADAVRREAMTGTALRLSGIVARPGSAEGFGSAFLSDVFHVVRDGEDYQVPVSRTATSWLMSAKICAANLVHALLSDFTEAEPIMLPATRVSMEDLVASAARYGDGSKISFQRDNHIQRLFASHPPLTTDRAASLGYKSDGTLDELVDNVFACT